MQSECEDTKHLSLPQDDSFIHTINENQIMLILQCEIYKSPCISYDTSSNQIMT